MRRNFRLRLCAALVAVSALAACGPRTGAEPESAPSATSHPQQRSGSSTTTTTTDIDPGAELALPEAAPTSDTPSDLTLPESPASEEAAATTAHPTAPGEYRYAVTGSVGGETAFGLSILTVSQVDATSRQVHTETSAGGTTTTTYLMRDDGRYIEAISIEAGPRRIELTAAEPVLLVPAGLVPGATRRAALGGAKASADIEFALLELDSERMIYRTTTRLAAQIDPGCYLEGTVVVTAAARTDDQLPLDVRTESEMKTVGETCTGETVSQLRAVLVQD